MKKYNNTKKRCKEKASIFSYLQEIFKSKAATLLMVAALFMQPMTPVIAQGIHATARNNIAPPSWVLGGDDTTNDDSGINEMLTLPSTRTQRRTLEDFLRDNYGVEVDADGELIDVETTNDANDTGEAEPTYDDEEDSEIIEDETISIGNYVLNLGLTGGHIRVTDSASTRVVTLRMGRIYVDGNVVRNNAFFNDQGYVPFQLGVTSNPVTIELVATGGIYPMWVIYGGNRENIRGTRRHTIEHQISDNTLTLNFALPMGDIDLPQIRPNWEAYLFNEVVEAELVAYDEAGNPMVFDDIDEQEALSVLFGLPAQPTHPLARNAASQLPSSVTIPGAVSLGGAQTFGIPFDPYAGDYSPWVSGGRYITTWFAPTLHNQAGWIDALPTLNNLGDIQYHSSTFTFGRPAVAQALTTPAGFFFCVQWDLDYLAHQVLNAQLIFQGVQGDRAFFFVSLSVPGFQDKATLISIPFPTGYAQVQKVSAGSPEYVDGNPNYSLAGAVYWVFDNQNAAVQTFIALNNGTPVTGLSTAGRVGVLTTNAQGVSNALQLLPGTYFAVEVIPSRGHARSSGPNGDGMPYVIEVVQNQTTTFTSEQPTPYDPTWLRMQKIDAETGLPVPQGDGTFEGIQYTVRWYAADSSTFNTGMTPRRTWVFETDAQGEIWFSNPSFLVPQLSSPVWLHPETGHIRWPLGVVTFQETWAPPGLIVDPTIHVGYVMQDPNDPAQAIFRWRSGHGGGLMIYRDGSGFEHGNYPVRGGVNKSQSDKL